MHCSLDVLAHGLSGGSQGCCATASALRTALTCTGSDSAPAPAQRDRHNKLLTAAVHRLPAASTWAMAASKLAPCARVVLVGTLQRQR